MHVFTTSSRIRSIGLLLALTVPASAAAGGRLDLDGDPLPAGALARLGSARLRHGDRIVSVGFRLDGKVLMSAGYDGQVRFWDVQSGKLLRARRGFAFSPDGLTVACRDGSTPEGIQLVDAETGKERCRVAARAGFLWSIAFSPDGKVVAAQSRDGKHCLWDARTGRQLHTIPGPGYHRSPVVFSDDSKYCAFSPTPSRTLVVEVASGKLVHEFTDEGERTGIHRLAFSPDGHTLALAQDDGTLRLWSLRSGKQVARSAAMAAPLKSLGFVRDGKSVVTGDANGVVRFWDPKTAREQRQVNLSATGFRFQQTFSPDGSLAASWGSGPNRPSEPQKPPTTIRLWDLGTGKERVLSAGHGAGIRNLGLSADGKVVATQSADDTLRTWDASTGKELARVDDAQGWGHSGAFFSVDGTLLVGGHEDGAVSVFHAATRARRVRLPGVPPYRQGSFALSPDGRVVAQIHVGGVVRLVRTADGKEVHRFTGHPGYVTQVAFSPDGRRLAVGGFHFISGSGLKPAEAYPGWVRVWDVEDEYLLEELRGYVSAITALAFSPDGRTLAAAGEYDAALSLREVIGGAKRGEWNVAEIPGSTGINAGYRAAFSASGRLLAAGGRGEEVHLIDLATGKAAWRHRCDGSVSGLAFHGDKRLVSGDGAGTALVWDVEALVGKRKPVPGNLTEAERNALWADLASADGVRAATAVWRLRGAPEHAVQLLSARLRPAVSDDEARKRMEQWIKDLDDDTAATRGRATKELLELGREAVPAVRMAAEEGPSTEVRRRAKALVVELLRKPWAIERVREVRAVEVLEAIGSPGAVDVLRGLARGTRGVPQTEEARAAIERLAARDAGKK